MENTILKCEGLSKKFGKKQILDNVSFEIQEGDILGFIGPNRCWKNNNDKIDTRTSKYYRRKS